MLKTKLAYILCAGKGTRLRPFTEYIPKPLIPVLDQPMVFHVLDSLRKEGVRRFLVNVYHRPWSIKRALKTYAQKNRVSIRFLHEKVLLGTGGPLRNAKRYLKEPFFLVNSDFLPFGFSFSKMEKKHKGLATLAVRPMKAGEKYNPVGVDKSGKLVRVKHVYGSGGKNHQFLGVQLIEPAVLRYLDDQEVFNVFNGLYLNIYNAGRDVFTYTEKNLFTGDMGTLKGYMNVHQYLLKKNRIQNWIGKGVKGWKDARIGGNAVIGNNCEIGAGSEIRDSIIFPNVRIPAGAVIRNAIVGSTPEGDVIGKAYMNRFECEIET